MRHLFKIASYALVGCFVVPMASPALAVAGLPPWWWIGQRGVVSSPLPSPEQVQQTPIAPDETWVSVPAPNTAPTAQTPTLTNDWPTATWWKAFGDPTLDTLMSQALAQNPSLLAAESQLQQAQANVDIVRAERLPVASIGANYTLQRFSKNQFPVNLTGGGGIGGVGNSGRNNHFYSIPLQASYDVDLWGKYRDKHHAAKRVADMAKHDYHNYTLQLSATVANAYWQWSEAQALLQSQQKIVALLEQATLHTSYQRQQGTATQASTLQAQQALEQAQQRLAQLQQLEATSRLALAPLVGMTPAQLTTQGLLSSVTPLPDEELPLAKVDLPHLIPTGIPGQLVAHRPDVQARWLAIEEAALLIRATQKEFLPALTLTGQWGLNSLGFSRLFDWGSLASSIGAGLVQPVYTGGRTRAALAIAKHTREALVQQYVATVQQAYAETESSLATLNTLAEAHQHGQQIDQQAQQLATETHQQWRYGLASEATWLPQQVLAEQAHQQHLQAKTQVLLAYIGVCRSVGGGF
jgi:NodT family efflux transporter outer membrane factor (OMF) lipoprotein